ncbi:hypothetical protein LCGC14_1107410 [marine sediment metagenome]|uniref:Uncharacterized protein n=1 Tax=marine sediment metagenome TaxID=412755 RepID=A0A0F9M7S0_9ZZZZ
MKEFFKKLPRREEYFVEPLMTHWLNFCGHPNVQSPSENRIEEQRMIYSNLYRQLVFQRDFYLEA